MILSILIIIVTLVGSFLIVLFTALATIEGYTDGQSDSWSSESDYDHHVGLPQIAYMIGFGEKARTERKDQVNAERNANRRAGK